MIGLRFNKEITGEVLNRVQIIYTFLGQRLEFIAFTPGEKLGEFYHEDYFSTGTLDVTADETVQSKRERERETNRDP